MIPLYGSARAHGIPWATGVLIGLCALAFGIELHSSSLDQLVYEHALIPARTLGLIERVGPLHAQVLGPLVSSMFLHDPGTWGCHLIGNVWFLWVFGSAVEGRLGAAGLVGVYLVGGLAAAAAQIAAQPDSTTPTIGASGAVASLMGAQLVLRPLGRIHSLVLLPSRIDFWEVPALVYLALWVALQFVSGAAGTASAAWAHAGGFAFGALAMLALGRRA